MPQARPLLYTTIMEQLGELLSARIGKSEVLELSQLAANSEATREECFRLLFDDDKRTSDNAAWIMTHLPKSADRWLQGKQTQLIDEAMTTASDSKRRLIMVLLDRLKFEKETLRTDFLDFCFGRLLDPNEPYGIRSLAAKLAYAQCQYFPELREELRQALELLEREELKPGLTHTRKVVMGKVANTQNVYY